MTEINNLTEYDLSVEELKKLADRILNDNSIEKDLSVAFLGSTDISGLNKSYRSKKGPTDVLSFKGDSFFLGEVLICPKVVLSEAKKRNLSFEKEIERVLIHGILHLLGYDHKDEKQEKEMKKIENNYFSG